MAISFDQFWDTNTSPNPPLTDSMIAAAEKILGVPLPSSLIALLRIRNGGYTQGFAHPMNVRTTWSMDHVPLENLAGIVTSAQADGHLNLLRTEVTTTSWGLPPKQVLLSGDGHYWITLDYRKSPEPSVAWIDVECGEDFQIAESFNAFLAGLVPSTTYGIEEDSESSKKVSQEELAAQQALLDASLLAGDRQFYELLGTEDASSKCRTAGCERGRIKLSVNCRVHHFEQIRGRKCPFVD